MRDAFHLRMGYRQKLCIEMGIEIDADSMGTLKTIGDVVDYLTAHQN